MKAASLLGVMLLAHLVALAGHTIPLSPWTPFVFFWQDVLVALSFYALDLSCRRGWLTWLLYAGLILYVAVNVPLARTLSTPLTWTMARAARGPLKDSIRHYITFQNCLWLGLVLGSGFLWPSWVLIRRRFSWAATGRFRSRDGPALRAGVLLGGLIIITLGQLGSKRIDTLGLDRNPILTFALSAFPRVNCSDVPEFSAPLRQTMPSEDLSRWRGSCSGNNVILILLESTGAEYLKGYGAHDDPTPNLTELAKTSILFENAYAAYPESIKGLFSVLCSEYPCFDSRAEDYASVRIPSLAAILGTNRYHTALFHSGRFMYLGMESIVRHRGFATIADAGDIGGRTESSFGIDEPTTVQAMLRWVDSLPAGENFFMTYLPIAGHHPYEAPSGGPFSDADDLGRYKNALHYGDAAIGEFVQGLRQRGLLNRSLLVFSGDHGEAFGQHEGNIGHTLFIYEENVHVPLLFVAPGLMHHSIRLRKLASLIDITPTLLDLLGINSSPDFQGRSLLPGEEQPALFCTDYSLGLAGLRDGPWKFIYDVDSGRGKLFDLSVDSAERTNLSMSLPARSATYRRVLLNWSHAQKKRLRLLTDSSVR